MHPDDSKLYRNIPEAMEHKMMEFQREGVRYALAHGGRVLLGDEMGLGKTVLSPLALSTPFKNYPGQLVWRGWADAAPADVECTVAIALSFCSVHGRGRFRPLLF